MVVGNPEPFAFITVPYPAAPHLDHLFPAHDISANVAFIQQDVPNGRSLPNLMGSGNIVNRSSLGCFVFAWCGDFALVQFLNDFAGSTAAPCQFKDKPDIGGCFLIRLHAPVRAFLVAVGT